MSIAESWIRHQMTDGISESFLRPASPSHSDGRLGSGAMLMHETKILVTAMYSSMTAVSPKCRSSVTSVSQNCHKSVTEVPSLI